MASNLFQKYIWLADTIFRAGRITFAEIQTRWLKTDQSEGKRLALRTFHYHRAAIEELFDINILCDERTNEYYIENADEVGGNSISNWLLNSFAVSNAVRESKSIRERVLIEDIPSARHHLTDLMDAMKQNSQVRVTYLPFDAETAFDLVLYPLFVKLYERRWYLYANKPDDAQIKLYALDRVLGVDILDEKFEMPADFSPADYVSTVFGVSVYEALKPGKIVLKAYGNYPKYLRALPMHHSQREIEAGDGYALFEYWVAPTIEFYQKVLSHHKNVEVVSPKNVRAAIKEMVRDIADYYSI